jgi:hypothetical protein
MYDLAQDPLLAGSKAKIEDICFASLDSPIDQLKDLADATLFDLMSSPKVLKQVNPFDISTLSYNSSDNSIRYIWKKQPESLNDSKQYFYNALNAYNQIKTTDPIDTSALGIAAYDLFKATNDNHYLSFAYKIYNRENVSKCGNIEKCINMIILSRSLYNLIKESKYLDTQVNYIGQLVNTKFDYKGYGGYFASQQAFGETGEQNKQNYSIYQNGIIAGILINKTK